MSEPEEIKKVIEQYEKMGDDLKKKFHEFYGLFEKTRRSTREKVSENVFVETLKEVIAITMSKAEMIEEWKQLQAKLDPDPNDKSKQLKRVLNAAFEDNLSPADKIKYRTKKGRGYRIFDYARDRAEELGIEPFGDEVKERLGEAYRATLSFPRRVSRKTAKKREKKS